MLAEIMGSNDDLAAIDENIVEHEKLIEKLSAGISGNVNKSTPITNSEVSQELNNLFNKYMSTTNEDSLSDSLGSAFVEEICAVFEKEANNRAGETSKVIKDFLDTCSQNNISMPFLTEMTETNRSIDDSSEYSSAESASELSLVSTESSVVEHNIAVKSAWHQLQFKLSEIQTTELESGCLYSSDDIDQWAMILGRKSEEAVYVTARSDYIRSEYESILFNKDKSLLLLPMERYEETLEKVLDFAERQIPNDFQSLTYFSKHHPGFKIFQTLSRMYCYNLQSALSNVLSAHTFTVRNVPGSRRSRDYITENGDVSKSHAEKADNSSILLRLCAPLKKLTIGFRESRRIKTIETPEKTMPNGAPQFSNAREDSNKIIYISDLKKVSELMVLQYKVFRVVQRLRDFFTFRRHVVKKNVLKGKSKGSNNSYHSGDANESHMSYLSSESHETPEVQQMLLQEPTPSLDFLSICSPHFLFLYVNSMSEYLASYLQQYDLFTKCTSDQRTPLFDVTVEKNSFVVSQEMVKISWFVNVISAILQSRPSIQEFCLGPGPEHAHDKLFRLLLKIFNALYQSFVGFLSVQKAGNIYCPRSQMIVILGDCIYTSEKIVSVLSAVKQSVLDILTVTPTNNRSSDDAAIAKVTVDPSILPQDCGLDESDVFQSKSTVFSELLGAIESVAKEYINVRLQLRNITETSIWSQFSRFTLVEGESWDFSNEKPFFENQRCSYTIEFWHRHMKLLQKSLWNLPREYCTDIFSKILVQSIEFLANSVYSQAIPSYRRVDQVKQDIHCILLMIMEFIPSFDIGIDDLLNPPPFKDPCEGDSEPALIYRLHMTACCLFNIMVIIASPLDKLTREFKRGFHLGRQQKLEKLASSQGNDDSKQKKPWFEYYLGHWMSLVAPEIFPLGKSAESELSVEEQSILALYLISGNPNIDRKLIETILFSCRSITVKILEKEEDLGCIILKLVCYRSYDANLVESLSDGVSEYFDREKIDKSSLKIVVPTLKPWLKCLQKILQYELGLEDLWNRISSDITDDKNVILKRESPFNDIFQRYFPKSGELKEINEESKVITEVLSWIFKRSKGIGGGLKYMLKMLNQASQSNQWKPMHGVAAWHVISIAVVDFFQKRLNTSPLPKILLEILSTFKTKIPTQSEIWLQSAKKYLKMNKAWIKDQITEFLEDIDASEISQSDTHDISQDDWDRLKDFLMTNAPLFIKEMTQIPLISPVFKAEKTAMALPFGSDSVLENKGFEDSEEESTDERTFLKEIHAPTTEKIIGLMDQTALKSRISSLDFDYFLQADLGISEFNLTSLLVNRFEAQEGSQLLASEIEDIKLLRAKFNMEKGDLQYNNHEESDSN